MIIDQATFPATKRRAALPNGIDLAFVEFGDPQGRPILFIHGFTDSARSWTPLIPHLPRRDRLILVDLRGHGGSSRPESGYARGELALDILLLLDALGLARVDLVGHSLGSLVAQKLAEDWPKRVGHVVLISSTATPESGEDEYDLAGALAGLEDPIDPNSAFLIAWFANPKPVDATFLAAERREAAAIPARLWRRIFDEALKLDGLSAELPFAAPALLIWGALDPIFGVKHRASLCRALPAAAVRIYESLGHNPFWEEPEAIGAEISGFL